MQTTTTISLRADDNYRKAIRALADDKDVDMADIVRAALDAKFGSELQPYIDFFVAQNERKNIQSSDGKKKKE